MASQHLASGRYHLPCQPPVEVFLEREHRFRLRSIALEDDEVGLVDADEGFVEHLRTDAARERFGTDAGEKIRE